MYTVPSNGCTCLLIHIPYGVVGITQIMLVCYLNSHFAIEPVYYTLSHPENDRDVTERAQ